MLPGEGEWMRLRRGGGDAGDRRAADDRDGVAADRASPTRGVAGLQNVGVAREGYGDATLRHCGRSGRMLTPNGSSRFVAAG